MGNDISNNISSHDDNNDDDDDYEDLALLLPTLELLVAQLEQHEHILEDLLTDLRYDEKLQNRRISRTPEKERVNRKTFTEINRALQAVSSQICLD
jgi:hypothetical protein